MVHGESLIGACRGCESGDLELVIDLGEMPLAGGFLADADAAAHERSFPLSTHVCGACGLVQIVEPIDPEDLFQDYSFSSSTIGPLVRHFEEYADWIARRYHPGKVVEIGCNDGVLLSPLTKRGMAACGVDISKNISEIARAKGLDVVTGYFDVKTAERIAERMGRVDLITGSNCFAHNAEPGQILDAAKLLLNKEGHLCLEVMYAGDLLEQLQWDTLYHEHLSFYSLGTLSVLLERYGFRVVHAERLAMHGGSLRIVASQTGGKPSAEQTAIQAYEEELALNASETWRGFGEESARKIRVVRETVGALSAHSRVWAYGAAGKATMWVNACKMDYLEAMVDASPLRAGKLMPGTHTPIVSPEALRESPPDYIFVTAWNYAEVIRAQEAWFDGIWLTPLPSLRFF